MKIRELLGLNEVTVFPYTRVLPCVSPDLVIGLELETENCHYSARDYQRLVTPMNFAVTTDGSLRGEAYEFISSPMRSDHALAALTDYFSVTGFNEANFTDRCSVHVHVNCLDLDQTEVSSVALLYTIIEEILMEYVGHNRDSNLYCIPWSHCRQHYDLVHRFLNSPGDTLKHWNKYTALNLLPLLRQGTIEFRQLYGTADMEVLTKWVNIIGSIMAYAKRTPLKDLMATIKEMNTVSNYGAFFRDVLQDLLPYNEVYRQRLEEGVVLAKYGMLSMTKKPPAKKVPASRVRAAAAEMEEVRFEPMPTDAFIARGQAQTQEGATMRENMIRQLEGMIQRQTPTVNVIEQFNSFARRPVAPPPAAPTGRRPIPVVGHAQAQMRPPLGDNPFVTGWVEDNQFTQGGIR